MAASADHSAEAGAPAIEATPAMIEAGVRAYYANHSDDPSQADAAEAVREIFTAMLRECRRPE
jgi:hypothetical protein